jgi:glycosyltransferase involved in cell wall biosynthesis
MNILFIHQNMPGQYKHLAPALARLSAHRVMFLTQRQDVLLPGVARTTYEAPRAVKPETHPYLRLQESAVLHGQQVVRSLIDLRRQGFVPNLVIGHPGWGELLFVRDVYPDVPVLSYAEFYYHGEGADIGFDAADHDKAQDLDVRCRARIRAGHLLQSLESCIQATSPTHWQKSVHPEAYHAKIKVIFDGVDTNLATPEGESALTLPDGTRIAQGDEVVSYVARNLEPYRGFRSLMRAIPCILDKRPDARIVIVGGDEVSYGSKPKDHANWREAMLAEVPFDRNRVHFVPRLAYGDFLKLMRATTVHVYLTYPFVLSWSCLEAMACGALVIGSDTAPVREVIRDGENGLLTDFFDHHALADKVVDVLADPRAYAPLRAASREIIRARYALDKCLPQQVHLLNEMTQGVLLDRPAACR